MGGVTFVRKNVPQALARERGQRSRVASHLERDDRLLLSLHARALRRLVEVAMLVAATPTLSVYGNRRAVEGEVLVFSIDLSPC